MRLAPLLETLAAAALFSLACDLAAAPGLGFLMPVLGLAGLSVLFRSTFLHRRIGWSYLALLGAFWGIFYWVPATLAVKGPMPMPLAILGSTLLDGWEALGLWGVVLLSRWLGRRSGLWGAMLGAGLGIGLWEVLAFHVYPFTLGAVFGGIPFLARAAAFVGSHGMSILLWGTGAGIGHRWAQRAPRPWLPAAGLAAVLAVLGLAWPLLPRGPERHLDIVIAQPDYPVGHAFPGMEAGLWAMSDATLHREGLPHPGRTTLLLWPESSVLGRDDLSPNPRLPLEARKRNIAWLYGTEGGRYNLVRGEAPGEPSFFQAKVVPMPFGERMPGPAPLREWLDRQMGFLSQEPGELSSLSSMPLPGGLKVHPLICSEALIPWRVIGGLDLAGGDLLANLTNDGWFDRSIATDLHGAQIRMRAIETGLPLVRATLTGKSGCFTADGRGGLWGAAMTRATYAFPLDWRPIRTPAGHRAHLVTLLILLGTATLLVGCLTRPS
nr:nitrilase-related carbon-nitrogen hydrolase [uncultured Holophaga sp.]